MICGICKKRDADINHVRDCQAHTEHLEADHYLRVPTSPPPPPPSQKQLDYAHGLLRSRVVEPGTALAAAEDSEDSRHEWINTISKETISQVIGELLDAPRLPAQNPDPAEVLTEGLYLRYSDVYSVRKSLGGRMYAMRYVASAQKFEFAEGACKILRLEQKMTSEQIGAYGRLYGVCMICGRTLTNPESIANGIGPICANKV